MVMEAMAATVLREVALGAWFHQGEMASRFRTYCMNILGRQNANVNIAGLAVEVELIIPFP